MLSENVVVMLKKAVESAYTGLCTVTEYREYRKENGSTSHKEVVVLKDVPCRLSFSNITSADSKENVAVVKQVVKVFMSPDVKIKPGSKLTITQNFKTTEYKNSGEVALYKTHQEIILELFRKWV